MDSEAISISLVGYYNTVLLVVLAITIIWEIIAARRPQPDGHLRRWSVNFFFMVLNLGLVYVLLPVSSVAFALWVQAAGYGLLNLSALPVAVTLFVSILCLDFGNYWQHRLMHRIPFLWRAHRLHHTDTDCDATTSFRFHPLEVFFGVGFEFTVILVLGAPAIAVAGYRLARVAISTFVHGNVYLPKGLDAVLRLIIVTPDVHRIHHSQTGQEQTMNYSGGLIWWDKVFGSYQKDPEQGYANMAIGVRGYDFRAATSLRKLISDPFNEGT